jgi:hypothetical protein
VNFMLSHPGALSGILHPAGDWQRPKKEGVWDTHRCIVPRYSITHGALGSSSQSRHPTAKGSVTRVNDN